jgi:hypothetical protein
MRTQVIVNPGDLRRSRTVYLSDRNKLRIGSGGFGEA